jgi:DNA-3-methyladenine glycosylase I
LFLCGSDGKKRIRKPSAKLRKSDGCLRGILFLTMPSAAGNVEPDELNLCSRTAKIFISERNMNKKTNCWNTTDELLAKYHDEEWGTPLHDDRKLFEFLVLEGFQAGLSWITILRKRENFRKAFDNFDYRKIAKYGEAKIRTLLNDSGIIRNRLKIRATIENAKAFLNVRKEFGTFDSYIWNFIDNKSVKNNLKSFADMPAKTPLSDTISADLKRRGFRFVGSTIVYAHMQATGMVNDHLAHCFRYKEINRRAKKIR